jgi:phage portal protein BeeE
MGLLRYLRGDDVLEDSSNNGRDEARTFPVPDNELPLLGTYVGSPITPSAALAIADVWAAVRVLADAASSLPLHVYRRTETGRERVTSGKLVELLDRPGLGMTQADLVSSLMGHLAIWGNGYIGKYREQGEVTQLGLLNPEQVRPEIENGQLRIRYSPAGPQRMLTEADVVFVKGLSVDGLTGLSAVSQASRVLGLSDELVKHALSYFQVSDTGGVPRPAGRPSHFLNAGTGGDSLTYSTSESMSADFVKYNLTPWLRRIELVISHDRDLTFDRQYVKFSVDGLLRADVATRADVYTKALDPITGWMPRDEVRRLEDLEPEAKPPPMQIPMPTPGVANGRPRTPSA